MHTFEEICTSQQMEKGYHHAGSYCESGQASHVLCVLGLHWLCLYTRVSQTASAFVIDQLIVAHAGSLLAPAQCRLLFTISCGAPACLKRVTWSRAAMVPATPPLPLSL
jgi:hypothetical protein